MAYSKPIILEAAKVAKQIREDGINRFSMVELTKYKEFGQQKKWAILYDGKLFVLVISDTNRTDMTPTTEDGFSEYESIIESGKIKPAFKMTKPDKYLPKSILKVNLFQDLELDENKLLKDKEVLPSTEKMTDTGLVLTYIHKACSNMINKYTTNGKNYHKYLEESVGKSIEEIVNGYDKKLKLESTMTTEMIESIREMYPKGQIELLKGVLTISGKVNKLTNQFYEAKSKYQGEFNPNQAFKIKLVRLGGGKHYDTAMYNMEMPNILTAEDIKRLSSNPSYKPQYYERDGVKTEEQLDPKMPYKHLMVDEKPVNDANLFKAPIGYGNKFISELLPITMDLNPNGFSLCISAREVHWVNTKNSNKVDSISYLFASNNEVINNEVINNETD